MATSQGQFIQKAKDAIGSHYDFSKTIFTKTKDTVVVTCSTHGDFTKRAQDITCKKQGCQQCAELVRRAKKTKTTAQFIQEAIAVHGNAYSYDKVIYKNANTPVEIFCNTCKIYFSQIPPSHISQKHGCMECGKLKTAKALSKAKPTFIAEAIIVHGNAYDYTAVVYKNDATPVAILCNSCGTTFKQRPLNHLHGNGCPSCAITGFDRTKPAILYYLSINDGQAYKIGITNRSINERFLASELTTITVLKTWYYSIGYEAYTKEQRIIKAYTDRKYIGPALLSSGNTELFSIDILKLDNR